MGGTSAHSSSFDRAAANASSTYRPQCRHFSSRFAKSSSAPRYTLLNSWLDRFPIGSPHPGLAWNSDFSGGSFSHSRRSPITRQFSSGSSKQICSSSQSTSPQSTGGAALGDAALGDAASSRVSRGAGGPPAMGDAASSRVVSSLSTRQDAASPNTRQDAASPNTLPRPSTFRHRASSRARSMAMKYPFTSSFSTQHGSDQFREQLRRWCSSRSTP